LPDVGSFLPAAVVDTRVPTVSRPHDPRQATQHRIYTMIFANVYPRYVAKAKKKDVALGTEPESN
jgi:hypothetical protein